jgi:hypothetical protein
VRAERLGSACQEARHVRLRDRRRRLRRLRPRQPPLRRSGRQRAAARGRRPGHLALHPHPRDDGLPAGRPARLALPHGAPGLLQPAALPVAAGADPRRLQLDQLHDLHPGPRDRLRPVGSGGQQGVELRGRPARLPQVRAQRAHGGSLPRPRRPAQRGRPSFPSPALRDVRGLGPGDGRGRQRRLQRAGPGRRGLLPGHPEGRAALEHRERLPAAGAGAPEPDRDHRSAHVPGPLLGPTGHRRRVRAPRTIGPGRRRPRDRPLRRQRRRRGRASSPRTSRRRAPSSGPAARTGRPTCRASSSRTA